MRMVPKQPAEQFVYSLEVKRDWRRHGGLRVPGEAAAGRDARGRGGRRWRRSTALGCRDVARIDFRLRDGVPYFLEVNPLPGLNPESSDLVLLAYRMGLTHPQLIGMILDAAVKRCGLV